MIELSIVNAGVVPIIETSDTCSIYSSNNTVELYWRLSFLSFDMKYLENKKPKQIPLSIDNIFR